MMKVLSPTRQLIDATNQIRTQIPLTSLEKCQYKYCKHNSYNEIQEPQKVPLEKLDEYWADFLRAQRHSSANYIYQMKQFGKSDDPTLVKKEPVPVSEIHGRALHMPYLAGLLKPAIFLLLSFLLNLVRLSPKKQMEFIERMLELKRIDMDILNYLHMISRHPNSGLTCRQLKEFNCVIQYFLAKDPSAGSVYYNPEHLFMKPFNQINPYELEYLNNILHSDNRLTAEQSMYLSKFVCQLQEHNCPSREKVLDFLREKQILPFKKFEYLIAFLVNRAKRVSEKKLKALLNELYSYMDIGPCEVEPKQEGVKKPTPHRHVHVDYERIHKALSHLKKAVLPNIVRFTDLKNFLREMMETDKAQVMNIFNTLKILNIADKGGFKYLDKFITDGHLGKVDKAKQDDFLNFIRKISKTPPSMEVMINVDIPPVKGPVRPKVERKSKSKSAGDIRSRKSSMRPSKRMSQIDKKAGGRKGK